MRVSSDEAGDWQKLDSSTQEPRYVAIVEMLREFEADRSVLDIGCGKALLRTWLPKDVDYTGVERSGAAVRAGRELHSSARIIHAAAETFNAEGKRFGTIVFNEMLYYAADPVGLLARYAPLLWEGGMILCSIYQNPRRVSLKRRLRRCLNHRLPLSNTHCEKMVRDFMARKAWQILASRSVTMGTSAQCHIWLARPPLLSLAGVAGKGPLAAAGTGENLAVGDVPLRLKGWQ
jgi:predicted TPR repeat methyltransferase